LLFSSLLYQSSQPKCWTHFLQVMNFHKQSPYHNPFI
jgi:hypothetical protein